MKDATTIDVQATASQQPPATPETQHAIMVRPEEGGAVGQALSLADLKKNLEFIRSVMREVMVDGQDYGKVPGCGDKPGLFQPGAQKLLMTFQLTDQVQQERVVDLPNYHREYSFVVRLLSRAGRFWDGVGTCSTLEAKYRYRKAERKCPACGKHTIIKGKEEYGGGWICFAKKGGCGVKFPEKDPDIISQNVGQIENDNPADYWNTVRKMAFKRALVHAAINATNTSELWSQDLEDLPKEPEDPPQKPSGAPGRSKDTTQTPKAAATPTSAPSPANNGTVNKMPGPKARAWMIDQLKAGPGELNRQIATEYFEKVGQLIPTEAIEELPFRFVPNSAQQMRLLAGAIAAFEAGGPAEQAFPAHPPYVEEKEKPIEVPREKPEDHAKEIHRRAEKVDRKDPLWWRHVIVPIPHKGEKRSEYMKHPETIGWLYDQRHEQTADAQELRQRLWGFMNHYEPKGWTKNDGTEMPPSEGDILFREALDALAEHLEREGEEL